MFKETTLRGIIAEDMNLFHLNKPRYAFHRSFSKDTIRDMHLEIIDLPEGVMRTEIEYLELNEDGRFGCLENIVFMEYEHNLVPLGTHVSSRKSDYEVFKLDNFGKDIARQQLYAFILERLPNTVLLTRVLSEDEVKSWSNGGELGSEHQLFWKERTIHTAYHSITSEFKNSDNYSRAINIYVDKEKIKEQIQRGNIDIATYENVFTDRKKDSPFPFDMELTFRGDSFQTLKEGYQSWRKEVGVDSIQNPFYNQTPIKI